MRHFVHELRSRCDALLTGVGTILADDPELTCRAPADNSDSPAVFILDSHLRTPPNARVFEGATNGYAVMHAVSTKRPPDCASKKLARQSRHYLLICMVSLICMRYWII